jgi:hypothetical protein
MDMTKSIGNTVPFLGNGSSPGVVQTSLTQDGNYAENGHAFVMVLAMLIIFPLGIIMVRTLERVQLHIIFQSIGLGLVLLGLMTGIAISLYYNRVRPLSLRSSADILTDLPIVVPRLPFRPPNNRHTRRPRLSLSMGHRLPAPPHLQAQPSRPPRADQGAQNVPRPHRFRGRPTQRLAGLPPRHGLHYQLGLHRLRLPRRHHPVRHRLEARVVPTKVGPQEPEFVLHSWSAGVWRWCGGCGCGRRSRRRARCVIGWRVSDSQ